MTKFWKHTIAAATASISLALPAFAQGVDQIVQLEVLDGGASDDGTYQGALRLTLQDGWKTYWRAPGDAGIPPEFDWGGSGNVADVSITWPAPSVFDQNGLQSIGYEDQLVLPVQITPKNPAKPVRLRGEMDLGVCKDVCVPGRLDIDHTLDADAGRHPAIAAALAQRPYSAAKPEWPGRAAPCSQPRTECGSRRISICPRLAGPRSLSSNPATRRFGLRSLTHGGKATR